MTCSTSPFYPYYKHVFDGGNNHPYNPLGARGEFPEGNTCLCGEMKWHNMSLEESFNRYHKKIELFARQKTEGWDVWGNEVESDIELITEN